MHFAAKACGIDSVINDQEHVFVGHRNEQLEPFDQHIRKPMRDGEHSVIGYDYTIIDPMEAREFMNMPVTEAFRIKTAQKIAKYRPLIDAQRAGRRYTYIPMVFSAFGAASTETLDHLETMFGNNRQTKTIVVKKVTMMILIHAGRAIRRYWGDAYER